MDANVAKLEEMNFYIEAGRFLNDFDRNNNFDLKEILDFFKPNNRLFGDYEIRKKNGLERFLDRKNYGNNNKCQIPKDDIRDFASAGYLLLFVISGNDLRVNYGWIKILDNDEINCDDAAEALSIPSVDIKQVYVLDPIKLKQIYDLSDARNKYFKNLILEKCIGEDFVNYPTNHKDVYYEIIKNIVAQKTTKQPKNRILNGLKDNAEYDDIIKGHCEKILDEFDGNNELTRPLVKLKNFEEFKDVTIRLGIYEDGRYVIYLHPYLSESNCPGRIPSE
jgi:hypothetical protein